MKLYTIVFTLLCTLIVADQIKGAAQAHSSSSHSSMTSMSKDDLGQHLIRLLVAYGKTDSNDLKQKLLREAFMVIKAGATLDITDQYGQTPLVLAASMGHGDLVRKLLAAGATVDYKGRGQTALIKAINNEHFDVVGQLLGSDADVYKRDSSGKHALDYAKKLVQGIKYSELPFEKRFIEGLVKEAAKRQDRKRNTDKNLQVMAIVPNQKVVDAIPIDLEQVFKAIDRGDREGVNQLLSVRSDFVNAESSDKGTPLAYAITQGKDAIVYDLLREHNADVNQLLGDDKDTSALFIAIDKNEPKMVEQILAHGADLNSVNKSGQTPLDLAFAKNNPEVIETIENHIAETLQRIERKSSAKDDEESLGDQAPKNVFLDLGLQGDAIEAMIQHNKERDQSTIFDAAAAGNNTRINELLTDNPSLDIDAQDDEGYTALCRALAHGQHRTVTLLLEKGANPDKTCTIHNISPLLQSVLSYKANYQRHGKKLMNTEGWKDNITALIGAGAQDIESNPLTKDDVSILKIAIPMKEETQDTGPLTAAAIAKNDSFLRSLLGIRSNTPPPSLTSSSSSSHKRKKPRPLHKDAFNSNASLSQEGFPLPPVIDTQNTSDDDDDNLGTKKNPWD